MKKWWEGASRNDWFPFVLTVLIMVVVAWWLIVVALQIGTPPAKEGTATAGYDAFARAKDILVILIPIMTTAFGYWFGVAGKSAAEKQAAVAETQLKTVLAKAPPDLLEKAMKDFPEAFGLTKQP